MRVPNIRAAVAMRVEVMAAWRIDYGGLWIRQFGSSLNRAPTTYGDLEQLST